MESSASTHCTYKLLEAVFAQSCALGWERLARVSKDPNTRITSLTSTAIVQHCLYDCLCIMWLVLMRCSVQRQRYVKVNKIIIRGQSRKFASTPRHHFFFAAAFDTVLPNPLYLCESFLDIPVRSRQPSPASQCPVFDRVCVAPQ